MTTKILNDSVPCIITHPGELIKDELMAREIKQKELAALMNIPASVLNDVIKGKRSISAEMAVLLETVLEIEAQYWLSLQAQYDIDKVRLSQKIQEQQKNNAIWNTIIQYIPKKTFKLMGIEFKNIGDNIKKIFEIFNVNNIDEFFSLYAAESNDLCYFKKSEKLTSDKRNIFAWKHWCFYNNKREHSINVEFNHLLIDQLINELNIIFYDNKDSIERSKKCLAKYGIKLMFIAKFDQTPIDGFSFWQGDNPTIVLTLRLNKIDNFAFSLMHELGHIYLHLLKDKSKKFINIYGDSNTEFECEANDYAMNHLISCCLWNEFMKTHSLVSPHAIESKIKRFSDRYKINPAIILGRYQHDMKSYGMRSNIERCIN